MAVFILVFFILITAYGFVIDRYRKGWNQLPVYLKDESSPSTYVSVIIAARNEEKNIIALTNSLRDQDYSAELFEVIVVDDDSTDATRDQLRLAARDFQNLQILSVKHDLIVTGHKKKAIEAGIGIAKGNLIITSDADCVFSPGWISTIVNFYEKSGAKMIAAPVKLTGSLSFLYYFQVLDFLSLQGITGAALFKQLHVLCNGANLAYEKKVFKAVGGFKDIDHLASGDDMLLMQKIKDLYPEGIAYLKNTDAVVSTAAAGNWRAFFQQRIRWSSKAPYYKDRSLLYILALVYAVNLSFIVLLLFIPFNYGA
ncbi:MAG TPA: glycosyltransferase, partial [Flavitalea sp.]|nr:glycosyltransferase [Flavitalea sp.]